MTDVGRNMAPSTTMIIGGTHAGSSSNGTLNHHGWKEEEGGTGPKVVHGQQEAEGEGITGATMAEDHHRSEVYVCRQFVQQALMRRHSHRHAQAPVMQI